jgi:hypothetical protein
MIASRIPMLHFPLVHYCDCLKAPMRVLVHSPRLVRRPKLRRAGVIQQQEGADAIAEALKREGRADRKPIAYPMGRRLAFNADYFLHGVGYPPI